MTLCLHNMPLENCLRCRERFAQIIYVGVERRAPGRQESKYAFVTCRECGKRDEACYMKPAGPEMIQYSLCFTCNFWRKLVEGADDPRIARVDGKHYYVNEPKAHSRWNGFGGHRFTFRWHDGREKSSNDVWSQGTIPEHFRSRLPDNAEILK